MGSFEATSEVLPLPSPRLPHQTETGEKVGKDAKMLKNETPGHDPPSDPTQGTAWGRGHRARVCRFLFSPAVPLRAYGDQI